MRAIGSDRLVIVGSGKAAIEVLSQLEPSDSIVWAHRGHTAFYNRRIVQEAYDDDGKSFRSRLLDILVEANHRGEHWTGVAVEKSFLLACDGPLTGREGKLGEGIVDAKELVHASQFRQLILESLETSPNGHVVLKCTSASKIDGDDLVLGEKDCLVLCTGQRNTAWQMPTFEEAGVVSSCLTSASAPLHALPAVCLAIHCFHMQDKLHLECKRLMKAFYSKQSELFRSQRDERVLGGALGAYLSSQLMSTLLPKLRLGDLNH